MMVVKAVSKTLTKLFGSRNERLVKAYYKRVAQINELEEQVRQLSDPELRAKTDEFRERSEQGEQIGSMMPEMMAVAREAMDRTVGIRSIFNPEHGFDPATLPSDEARGIYRTVAAQIEQLPPIEETGSAGPLPGWMQVSIPTELYDAVRQLYPESRPPFRARPFDVQLIGGMVLGEGKIAEMKTGEGKTIVAPLACYVACIGRMQCHVVTVNDFLVQRDRDWVFPFYCHLGLTVGAIHPFHMQPPQQKAEAYHCDVVYGTNSEFGFDYLRDNMKLSVDEQVQKQRDFCIIDEVDSILIDEARTPLIISGLAHEDAPRYGMADGVARHLMQKQSEWDSVDQKVQQVVMRIKGLEGDARNARDKDKIAQMHQEREELEAKVPALEAARDQHVQYYEVELEKKASHLTHEGVAEAQKVAGIGSFYVGNNMDVPHLLENALRAHAVYQRDKDYVVQNGEVIIVDEFTGRLMIGRQWSDGLHQAVEAKERVKIKQETQTMATVTIQNFFKLYKRLAGMTGTAITEATEFNDIYSLDVVCIPTNLPVIRDDRNDLIFLSQKDKWDAILDEIKRVHDVGQPILVGTTSVESSEKLSQMLTKKYGIQHEVLNAKQHEREAHIVVHAGTLGAVTIATNMAGRGTDIKLATIDRADLVRHWQQRNMLPRDAKPELDDETLLAMAYRHIASWTLKIKPRDMADESDEQIRLKLLRHWAEEEAWVDSDKVKTMDADALEGLLDRRATGFALHRFDIFKNIEQMGGLHIVGTERHEARRIDNQLRGRSGRQGDRGSSRFFISLKDDLMAMFASKTVLSALSRLGMKEGDVIEHKWITKSVERAQRKVEERNLEIRKNLLEYDEVMEYQRDYFYGIRQDVLEGRSISQIIFDYIGEAVDDAVALYLDKGYTQTQVAEWCRQKLDVSVDPAKLRLDTAAELDRIVRSIATVDVRQIIDVTLGEYMSDDLDPAEWDLRGLSSWAMSRFSVDLKQNQLRKMSPVDVLDQLSTAAAEQIERKDLAGLQKFIDPLYGPNDLAEWCMQQFGLKFDPKTFAEMSNNGEVIDAILERARQAYTRREIEYPVEFIVEMVFSVAQHDGEYAARQLVDWARQRYEIEWTPEEVVKKSGEELQKALMDAASEWTTNGKLEAVADKAIAEHDDAESLAAWASQRFGMEVTAAELAEDEGRRDVLIDKGRQMLRTELTELERFVLLQILDTAWKDHLYSMDQLKDSVGLRGYAEKDPRTEYKVEGSNQFQELQKVVRDRVTELIFRARLTADVERRSVYGEQEARHAEADGAYSASAAAAQGTADQRADMEAAQRAGGGGEQQLSRKQRRAQAARGESERPRRDDDGETSRGQRGAASRSGGSKKRQKPRRRKRR